MRFHTNSAMICFSLITSALLIHFQPGLAVAQKKSAQDSKNPKVKSLPDPIKIERKGGRPRIPEVPRDEVICFALYTVDHNILKLSAQLYPLKENESRRVLLQIEDGQQWKTLGKQNVDQDHWMTTFRIENWQQEQDVRYRLTHSGGAKYTGTIRKDPGDKQEIVVAAFSCNSNSDRGPRDDMVANVKAQDPDLLFFAGDQSYDHKQHLAAWLLFGRQFGEIIKDYPTITIPDDHDVGQGNLWGEGGKAAKLKGGADGGYTMPAKYVNMVQRAQTSHLPDPYDPTKVLQGITVYYTSLNVGGIDFAILEDRKWKSGPAGLIPPQGPRPDHINDPNYERRSVDVPEARLLGERQLKFLNKWGQDWTDADFKVVLSQTIFAGGAHIHGQNNARLLADLDSNGWPQSGRARALREIRRCFGFHIAGDQHLATVIHHGVNSWEDSGFSFCVPSIVNYYGRWWWPLEKSAGRLPHNPLEFAGRYYDGLGNLVTMHAYANPTEENYNGSGHGIIRFHKKNRTIKMECWPRHVDVTKPDAKQYPGWPITINQEDNYSRKPLAYLPKLVIKGQPNPVVQVYDEYLKEIVYTLRINGNTWRPPVFREAIYTIKVGEGDRQKIFTGVTSVPKEQTTVIEVQL